MTTKNIIKYVLVGAVSLTIIIMFFMSWLDVNPGEEAVAYKPYNGGINADVVYNEGTYFIAPWNSLIKYSILQESKTYESTVMDLNGTDITVSVAINFSVQRSMIGKLHLMHGKNYLQFVDDKSKGAIKDVIGRYTYEEVYSSKREALEGEIEEILRKDFGDNYLIMHYAEIADINLPPNIAKEITIKETQKQKNLTSELMKIEEKNLADAKVEEARGDSASLLINSSAEAEAINIKQKQLMKSPQYINYLEVQKWDGSFGTGNVFGEGVMLFKDIKK